MEHGHPRRRADARARPPRGLRQPPAVARRLRATRAARASRTTRGHGHDAPPTHTLAIVDSLTPADLRACAGRVDAWHDAGLATPLLIAGHEFERSLDAFPLEFGAILADHTVVAGANPFDGAARRSRRPAARLRGPGAQPSAAPARRLPRDARPRRRARRADRPIGARRSRRWSTSIARLEGHAADDAASAARHVERTLGTPDSAVAEVAKLAGVHDITSADARAALRAVSRRAWNGSSTLRRRLERAVTLARSSVRRSALASRSRGAQRSRSPCRSCALALDAAAVAQPPILSRADRAGQRLRPRHRRRQRRRDGPDDPHAAGRERRRRRGRDGADHRAVRRHPRIRRQAVREPRPGHRRRRARTTAC